MALIGLSLKMDFFQIASVYSDLLRARNDFCSESQKKSIFTGN